MRKTQQLICVCCPKGCRIDVTKEEDKTVDVKGYGCENGKAYALQESVCPMRILTTTVKINNGTLRVLPVMSEKEIPLHLWKEAMEQIRHVSADAPVSIGDTIIDDLCGTGVKLIASRSMSCINHNR